MLEDIIDGGDLLYTGSKRLFIDDTFIESRSGVSFRPGVATKLDQGRPVLVADQPWEHPQRLGFYNSVVFDTADDKFKIWYLAQHAGKEDMQGREAAYSAVGYAESTDGVTWTKPPVGVSYAAVETDPPAPDMPTNLLAHVSSAGAWPAHGVIVSLDPTLPAGHPERFKAAYDDETDVTAEEDTPSMAAIAHSSDGVTWQSYNAGQHVIGRAADTANQITSDPYLQTLVLVTREDLGGDDETRETRGTLSVAILDETGASLPGYGLTDADPLDGLDGLRERPHWHGSSDLTPLENQKVKLLFKMRDTRLYSFDITSGNS